MAFDFSVREVVELGRYPHRLHPCQNEAALIDEAMSITQISHLADRRMAWLSGGERLRVQLARVLAQIWEAPADGAHRWLLLDEPTSSLDLQHQHSVLATVRDWAHKRGVGVLMVLHDLNLALLADRLLVLDQGHAIAAGERDDPTLHLVLEQVFGGSIRIRPAGDGWMAVPQVD